MPESSGADSNQQVLKIVRGLKGFEGCTISLVKDRFNRTVYSLRDTKGKQFIVKHGHQIKESGSSIAREALILRFLKAADISFVPEIVYWDKTEDISIESFVGSRDTSLSQLDDEGLRTFAGQLYSMHALPVTQLVTSAAAEGILLHTTGTESLRTYGFERFEIVKAGCPDTTLVEWLEKRLQENLTIIEAQQNEAKHVVWGDIGDNFRTNGEQLFFIDWEHAQIGSGSELAYVKIHSHISASTLHKIIALYARASGIAKSKILHEIARDEQIIRVNDVIWAAMKWAQAHSTEEAEMYKKLTYARQKLARQAS